MTDLNWADPAAPLSPEPELPRPELRMKAARAVMAEGGYASLLGPGNTRLGTTGLQNAVAQDLPFYVRTHPRMLAVDFDTPTAVAESLRLMVALLRRGWAPVLCDSGANGHRHVFCRLPPGIDRERLLRDLKLPSSDADVRIDIRPPCVRHRAQGRSVTMAPADPQQAVDRLADAQDGRRPLGYKAAHILDTATPQDDSAALWSLALGAANAGWTFEDLMIAVTGGANISAAFTRRIRKQGEEGARHWLEQYLWEPALLQVRREPAVRDTSPDPALLQAGAWALTRPWPGRGGATDFCVFMALLWGWRRSGRRRFNLSQRDIEVFAGISSRATVAKSLERLEAMQFDGQPVLTHSHDDNRAARLQNAVEWEVHVPATLPATEADLAIAWHLIQHDLFRNHLGLGKRAAMVILAVRGGLLLDSTEISAGTGLSITVVTRAIEDLEEVGLLARVDDRCCANDGDLGAAARKIGAAGRGDRQRTQIARERQARDIAMSQHDERRN